LEQDMSVRLTLICHASTRAVRAAAFPTDEPLDPSGLAKATALAAELRRVDVAWTSPALRARQAAAALNLKAVVEPALKDLDYGAWAGRSFDEVAATDPDALASWTSDCAATPHGGESILELLDRTAEWLDRIATGQSQVVAITHAAVARAAIIITLDAKPAAFWRIDVAPLCRVRLRGDRGRWSLLSMNVSA
jgi:broad specificity phosphatase PhoE